MSPLDDCGPVAANITEQLLRAGIAPRHAKRLAREFSEHFDDLTAAHCGNRAVARERLGTDDIFVAQALARPELKSWGARWPALVYGLGPSLMYPAIVLASILLILGVGAMWKASPWFAPLDQPTELAVFRGMFGFLTHGVPIVVALGFVTLAYRSRRITRWSTLGVAMVCLVGSFMDFGVRPSVPPDVGLSVWLGWSEESVFNPSRTLAWLLISFGVVGPLLAWVNRQLTHCPLK
ncbi:MAG: hypothetical protein FJX59_13765 [Alphaproteobacteria bacterium]|nr:hypothetical protein [Alphaproteobacteria bacterium]